MRLLALFMLFGCVFTAAGCTSHSNRAPVGIAPIGSLSTISTRDFDMHRIDSIVLAYDGEIIAALNPQFIKLGTKEPERQYGTWVLSYLDPDPLYQSLSKSDAELVMHRITPSPDRYTELMLNPGPQVINIGGFDHTFIIWNPEESPNQHHWVYYSGAGKVCEGTVSFILKSDS